MSATESSALNGGRETCTRVVIKRKALVPWRFDPRFVRSDKQDPRSVPSPAVSGDALVARRRKALVPWRFQCGYQRPDTSSFEENFLSDSSEIGTHNDAASCSGGSGSPTGSDSSCQHKSTLPDMVFYDAGSNSSCQVLRSVPSRVRVSASETFSGSPEDAAMSREGMRGLFQEYRSIYRNAVSGVVNIPSRPDLAAFHQFSKWHEKEAGLNAEKYVGRLQWMLVGDVLRFLPELYISGLHRHLDRDVDIIMKKDRSFATSIVMHWKCSDAQNDLDTVTYSTSIPCGYPLVLDESCSALVVNKDACLPVRVIHGFNGGNPEISMTSTKYIYGGLYKVAGCWHEPQDDKSFVFMCRLSREADQPKLDIVYTLKSTEADIFRNLYIHDFSKGLEKLPISVVNEVDDECIPPYQYMTKLKYPLMHCPAPPAGCDCTGGCSDSKKCACAVKNGGKLPFNHNSELMKAKPLVYECGPSCKCPPTCHNRASQHGVKFRLQIFKTRRMGWGVRTLEPIPSGSFICQYIGELLEDEVAQKRTNDDYIFAIGHNYFDKSLWKGLSTSIPALQNGPPNDGSPAFAVDGLHCGNFAKFINHSCTPNLYAQNLLYDHDDTSMPHIAFFATENIPAMQELKYHYNYMIDQVYDSNGNLKKKACYCESDECTGWLY